LKKLGIEEEDKASIALFGDPNRNTWADLLPDLMKITNGNGTLYAVVQPPASQWIM
jgi:hypothetical protein